MTKRPPPNNFRSWLAYAVATMDTRTLNIETLFCGPVVSREEFRAAAEAELAEVEALGTVIDDRDAELAHRLSVIAHDGVRENGQMRHDIGLLLMTVVRKAAAAAKGEEDAN